MNARIAIAATGILLSGVFGPGLVAQTATLTANSPAYFLSGGQITLTATVVYPTETSTPSAIAFSVQLPPGWKYVSMAGASAAVAPAINDNLLEWGFSSFPAAQLQFTFVVSYPAGGSGNKTATVTAAQYRSPTVDMIVEPLTFMLAQPPTISTHPSALTVSAGQGASFSVVASSALAMSYQWRKGGANVAGATVATYSIASAAPADAGTYDVVVTNSDGSVTSNGAALTVLYAPIIGGQPANLAVNQGQAASFTVTASGYPAPTYQWRKGGTNIAGNTSASTATLTLASAQLADAGIYDVVITNSQGSATSAGALLTVSIPPAFTSHPASATVTAGNNVTLSATATGTPAPGFQWRKNGANISGATNASLAFSPAQAGDAGSYDVVATNVAGAVTSNAAVLTVNVPPAITTQPAGATVNAGLATFALSVVASGSPAPTYQWLKNGTNIAGATGTTLSFAGVAAADAGLYRVVVSNVAGSVTSNEITLTVNVPPAITTQPATIAVGIGTNMAFSVTASGTAPLSYQWIKDGTAIAGATTASLPLTSVSFASAGVYRVTVSNVAGNVASNPAVLSVVDAVPTHAVVGPGYVAGGTVTISNNLTFAATTAGAGWQVLLPAGWSYLSGGGGEGDVKPVAGTTGLLEWAWTEIPASPITFTYTLSVPAGASGDIGLAALAVVRQSGVVAQIVAKPDPLVVSQVTTHSADTDRSFRLSLLELTRVIELYNTRNGTTRTGCYAVLAGSEDGFTPEPTRASSAVVTLARYHSADSDRNGKLSLLELTRVIELYNYRVLTTRTGQYHAQAGTEDGFAPGPAP